MRAVRAIVENGKVTLQEALDITGRVEAVLVILDPDPWDGLIRDARPRPALSKASQEAMEEFRSGKTTPLDPDAMT